jgi:N-acetylglucosaminyl-diphospho-decaprenol L-rhamnosyltransferase
VTAEVGAAPRVALVVVNHRSAELVDQLLTGAAGGADEVVVVDCTPAEAGLADVCARHGARLVDPGANLGYGGGADLGAADVVADVIVVANPDVEIAAGALRSLAAAALGVGLVAPRLTFADGTLQRSAHRREPRALATAFDLSVPFQAVAARLLPGWHPTLLPAADHEVSGECAHVLGAIVAVDAAAWRSVGGFDPAYFLYREETDLCHRLRAAGWAVRFDATVAAVHRSGGSTDDARPVAARPAHLESHDRFVRSHWGRGAALRCRAVGALAAASSAVTGPARRAWWDAMRWEVRGR